MKFRIVGPNGDSFELEADTVEEIRQLAGKEIIKRNWPLTEVYSYPLD